MFVEFLVVLLTILALSTMRKPKNFPPGPIWWPLVGCSAEMKSEARRVGGRLQIVLEKMRQKYRTNVVGLKMGGQLVVCVSTFDVFKKVFDNEDFFARPNNAFIKLRFISESPGITCAEGKLFDVHKRFILKNIESRKAKVEMEAKIVEELEDIMEILRESPQKVQFGKIMQPAVVNIIWSFIAGERIKRSDPQFLTLLKLLQQRNDAFDMGGGVLSNFPWLRYVAPDWVGYTLLNNLNMELKNFFTKSVEEHHKTWEEQTKNDFIYSFISKKRAESETTTFTDDQLLMVILDFFVGGAHSSAATLDFAILLMLHFPEVKRKVQVNLDEAIDSSEPIRFSDRQRVPYVEATLAEVMRCYHVFPVGGSRRALRDTKLEGYTIPKDTTILVDMYSILNSKEAWEDPEVFRPERFLVDGQFKMIDSYIPFGIGKRRCLGEGLARRILFLVFAEVMRRYDVLPEEGQRLPSLMPLPGIAALPQPYAARFVERTSSTY